MVKKARKQLEREEENLVGELMEDEVGLWKEKYYQLLEEKKALEEKVESLEEKIREGKASDKEKMKKLFDQFFG